MEDNQILVLRDNAKNQLMQIKTVEDGMTHLNKLKSIEVWVKAEKKDAELQNIVAEQKLRTQRILGGLLKDKELPGKNGGDTKSSVARELDTLDDMGLSKKQSSTFQQIASIPEERFEEFIQEKKEAVQDAVAELTTTGAIRLAKSLKQKEADLMVTHDINQELQTNKELRELANHINTTYSRDQRTYLISHIKQ